MLIRLLDKSEPDSGLEEPPFRPVLALRRKSALITRGWRSYFAPKRQPLTRVPAPGNRRQHSTVRATAACRRTATQGFSPPWDRPDRRWRYQGAVRQYKA